MDNFTRIAVLNGTPIYAISRKDYVNGMEKEELDPTVYYMILDAQNLMFMDGKLYGKVIDNGRSVKRMKEEHWRIALRAPKKIEEVIVSERALRNNDGERKLAEVVEAGRVARKVYENRGEEALNAVADAGEKALENKIAAVKSSAGAKRTRNPVSRKKSGGV